MNNKNSYFCHNYCHSQRLILRTGILTEETKLVKNVVFGA